MNKRMRILLFAMICLLMLNGCGTSKEEEKETSTDIEKEVEVLRLDDEETYNPDESAPSNTDVSEDEEKNDKTNTDTASVKKDPNNHTVSLKAPVNVFENPGYDYSFVDTIWGDGTYTIVKEEKDEEGNLWGKLKSGIGWIDLTRIDAEKKNPSPIRIGVANEDVFGDDCYEKILEDSEYTVRIAVLANDKITDIQFLSLLPDMEGYSEEKVLFTMDKLTDDEPLVVGVVFTGDFTTFGIRFTDKDGIVQQYAIYMSGRNGELVMQEF